MVVPPPAKAVHFIHPCRMVHGRGTRTTINFLCCLVCILFSTTPQAQQSKNSRSIIRRSRRGAPTSFYDNNNAPGFFFRDRRLRSFTWLEREPRCSRRSKERPMQSSALQPPVTPSRPPPVTPPFSFVLLYLVFSRPCVRLSPFSLLVVFLCLTALVFCGAGLPLEYFMLRALMVCLYSVCFGGHPAVPQVHVMYKKCSWLSSSSV